MHFNIFLVFNYISSSSKTHDTHIFFLYFQFTACHLTASTSLHLVLCTRLSSCSHLMHLCSLLAYHSSSPPMYIHPLRTSPSSLHFFPSPHLLSIFLTHPCTSLSPFLSYTCSLFAHASHICVHLQATRLPAASFPSPDRRPSSWLPRLWL